ncbi:MAG: AMIN domain-containing protein [Myxococcota bacterium]|nr:AMIN domain-containing protein [Myxococcota bacterium]
MSERWWLSRRVWFTNFDRRAARETCDVFLAGATVQTMPRWCGRVLSVLFALSVFVCSSGWAGEPKHSTLSEITIDEVDNEIVVGIRGTKLPDFTSFTQRDPHRIIVDWAGSVLGDVPSNQPFERSLVRAIRTEQFSTESEKISRVTVELSLQSRYRFETIENEIFIRFLKVAVPEPSISPKPDKAAMSSISSATQEAIASLDEPIPYGPLTEPAVVPPPPGAKKERPLPKRLLADLPDPAAKSNSPKPPKVVPQSPTPVEKAKVLEKPPAVALARISAKENKKPNSSEIEAVTKLAKAPKIVTQEQKDPVVSKDAPLLREVEAAKPKAKAVAAPPVRLASSAQAVTDVVLEKRKQATKKEPSEQKQSPQPPVKVAAKEPTPPKAPDQAALKPVKQTSPPEPEETIIELLELSDVEPAESAPQPEVEKVQPKTVRRLATVSAKEQQPAKPKPTPKRPPVLRLATVRASPQSFALPPRKPAKPKAKPQTVKKEASKVVFAAISDAKPGRRVMKYIGFRQKAKVSEVFIRCDGKAKFQVVETQPTRIVVQLKNTTIRLKNNQRALDTSFFPTAVQRVQAKSDSKGTRVEIALSKTVPYEVKRVGSTIKLLFNNAAR